MTNLLEIIISSGAREPSKDESKSMIKKVHDHTHIPLISIDILLKIAGMFNPWMNQ